MLRRGLIPSPSHACGAGPFLSLWERNITRTLGLIKLKNFLSQRERKGPIAQRWEGEVGALRR